MKTLYLALAAVVLMTGCSTVGMVEKPVVGSIIQNDLTAARDNIKLAIARGELAPNDPALPCLESVVGMVQPQEGPSYSVNGIISGASVAYVKVNGLQKLSPALQMGCQALVGKFLIDGVRAGRSALVPGL